MSAAPSEKSLRSENARLRAALRVAIAHLSEDSGQKDLPDAEKREDQALIARLKRALDHDA